MTFCVICSYSIIVNVGMLTFAFINIVLLVMFVNSPCFLLLTMVNVHQGREYARCTKITATAGGYQGTDHVSCLPRQVRDKYIHNIFWGSREESEVVGVFRIFTYINDWLGYLMVKECPAGLDLHARRDWKYQKSYC